MTAPPATRRRGQPLLALALMLGGWVGLRVATWEPLARPLLARAAPARIAAGPAASAVEPIPGLAGAPAVPPSHPKARPAPGIRLPAAGVAPASPVVSVAPPPPPVAIAPPVPLASAMPATPATSPPAAFPPLRRVAHALLWMAAVADLPLPPAVLAPPVPAGDGPLPATAARTRRWSADGWLLLRQDSGGDARFAGSLPVYGASQAGAVLRYRLAAGRLRPAAYLRATAALASGERGVAAGLSLRPLPALPLRVMAEARVDRLAGGAARARAAAFAVTEIAPVTLPAGVRAEFYAQGGYVAGPAATGFADGQLRLDRAVAGAPARGELRAGAGAWGGVQRGSARLDLGPSATIAVATGTAAARVAIDWRFRVAGNAAPASGPALTISAGF
ncbi:MAG: hypothetical protein KGM17_05190 [Sphingomonadales bacterium]|nr:hypothetical protein [Sphingomonadales bacterium]